ncbi:hypothetical protein [Persephonella sp.]
MLNEEEKVFLNQRKKIVKIGTSLVTVVISLWVLLYLLVIFKMPFMVNPEYFSGKLEELNDFKLIITVKLAPIFFNLFMMMLLLIFIFMLVFLNVEKDYLKIVKKYIEGKEPPKKEA